MGSEMCIRDSNKMFGPYAVSAPEYSPIIDYASLDPRVAVVVLLGAVAPVLGVALRHNPKEAGAALIGMSFVYAPIMMVFNIPFPVPQLIVSVIFVAGVALIATSMRG